MDLKPVSKSVFNLASKEKYLEHSMLNRTNFSIFVTLQVLSIFRHENEIGRTSEHMRDHFETLYPDVCIMIEKSFASSLYAMHLTFNHACILCFVNFYLSSDVITYMPNEV
jgi:hypothetical protein